MKLDYLLLGLSLLLCVVVGAYVYDREFNKPPPPKPIIEYWHVNF